MRLCNGLCAHKITTFPSNMYVFVFGCIFVNEGIIDCREHKSQLGPIRACMLPLSEGNKRLYLTHKYILSINSKAKLEKKNQLFIHAIDIMSYATS